MGGEAYLWPIVYIFRRGVISAVSPKSYVYTPLVVEGTALGSHATKRELDLPFSLSVMNGYAKPAKFDPPPMHPAMMSGSTSMASNCFLASSPMIDWCSRTWFKTEPRQYRESS